MTPEEARALVERLDRFLERLDRRPSISPEARRPIPAEYLLPPMSASGALRWGFHPTCSPELPDNGG